MRSRSDSRQTRWPRSFFLNFENPRKNRSVNRSLWLNYWIDRIWLFCSIFWIEEVRKRGSVLGTRNDSGISRVRLRVSIVTLPSFRRFCCQERVSKRIRNFSMDRWVLGEGFEITWECLWSPRKEENSQSNCRPRCLGWVLCLGRRNTKEEFSSSATETLTLLLHIRPWVGMPRS